MILYLNNQPLLVDNNSVLIANDLDLEGDMVAVEEAPPVETFTTEGWLFRDQVHTMGLFHHTNLSHDVLLEGDSLTNRPMVEKNIAADTVKNNGMSVVGCAVIFKARIRSTFVCPSCPARGMRR
jgi:hypothetical protein